MADLIIGNAEHIKKIRDFEKRMEKESDGKLRNYCIDFTIEASGFINIEAHSKQEAFEIFADYSTPDLLSEADDIEIDKTISEVSDLPNNDNSKEAIINNNLLLFDTVEGSPPNQIFHSP